MYVAGLKNARVKAKTTAESSPRFGCATTTRRSRSAAVAAVSSVSNDSTRHAVAVRHRSALCSNTEKASAGKNAPGNVIAGVVASSGVSEKEATSNVRNCATVSEETPAAPPKR